MYKAFKILSVNTKTKYTEQMLSSSTVCNAEQGSSSFGSVDEILKCGHSNEISCGTVYYAPQSDATFGVCG